MSKRTLGRVGACAAVAVGAVHTPAAAAGGLPATPTQDAYDGHLEEANAWAIEALNLPAAWETTRGEGVTIAVMDTGVAEHPYFDDKDILPGYSAYSDDEDDAWYDRPSGWDPALDSPDIDDKQGHGTAVTSQVLLAAPEATILPVRTGTGVADGFGNLFLDGATEIEAVRWAVDNGADAIVMAWGVGTETNEDVYMAMQYAVDHDVVLIASAGNEAEVPTTGQFPAFLRGVVTVSGLGDDGGAWESSTTGPEVDLAAPADYSLAVPVPQGSPHVMDDCGLCQDSSYGSDASLGIGVDELYMEVGGTSLSVGWVGGVVALIESAHPDLDANGVIQRLLQTAADQGDPGRDDVFGHGVPDAAAAIGAEVEPVEENPLGYPLGVPGASGVSPDGGPAPGTGAAADGATTDLGSGSGGSDLGPFVGVVLAAAAIAAAAWFVLQKRRSGTAGSGGAASTPLATGALVAVVVAMVAATGTYVAADVVGGDGSDGTTASGADGGSAESTGADAPAGDAGQLASDGNPAAVAAKAWQDAYTAGDLETFRSLTCENPWYRVAINARKLEDPGFVRPGFAILTQEGTYWGPEDYRLTRGSDGKAWVEAGNLSIGSEPDYQIALVLESGDWKVCDFWWTNSGWQGLPEWEQRFPRDDDSVGLAGQES